MANPRLLTTALRWPAGLLITWWAYVWRITPLHRREVPGSWDADGPPPLPADVSRDGIQPPESGSGAFLRRRYRVDVVDGRLDAASVIANVREDVNRVVPGGIARFRQVAGDSGPLSVGDEFVVRMPGPWDGPVRVIELNPNSFRFATLDGHLEAGQIEWRAEDLDDGALRFEVESWSRPGDRLSEIAHHRLRMAKEVQLHMWTSVLENVVKLAGGRMRDGVDIHTAVVDV